MDIRFGLEEYYGGLHCGEGMEVMVDGNWIPTRIEVQIVSGWSGCGFLDWIASKSIMNYFVCRVVSLSEELPCFYANLQETCYG